MNRFRRSDAQGTCTVLKRSLMKFRDLKVSSVLFYSQLVEIFIIFFQFQSHQIFHVLVVVAAFVHLHSCCEMALYRIELGRNCTAL